MIFRTILAAAVFALSGGLAHAQQVQIDDSFATTDFSWSSGGGALIRWRPVQSGDRILFCGAYANLSTGTRTSRFNREVMRKAQIQHDGATVLPNASFFAIINRSFVSEGLEGQMANCQDTGLSGVRLNDFRIDFYDGRYKIRR